MRTFPVGAIVPRFGTWLARGVSLGLMSLLGVACGPEYAPVEQDDDVFGETQEAVSACEGDDDQFDFNAFASSLAVAIAREMGRWDVATDFEIRGGKLELSSTGELHCGGSNGCQNVRALLRLQDDQTAEVPYHSPWLYRDKLVGWYYDQESKLVDLVDEMLQMDKGLYRIKVRSSGKYMSLQNGWGTPSVVQSGSTGDESVWRIELDGTVHRLVNRRYGLCMDLDYNSDQRQRMVARGCNDSFTQGFRFTQQDYGVYGIRTGHKQGIRIENSASHDGATFRQEPYEGTWWSMTYEFEPVGYGPHVDLGRFARAVYRFQARHSGMSIRVAGGASHSGARIEQAHLNDSDDSFHWYMTPIGDQYQLVNRRSGLCMDLEYQSGSSPLVQRACSTASTQQFYITPTGGGENVLYTYYGNSVEVQWAANWSGAQLGQGGKNWESQRMFKFIPVVAGEPHKLTFSHSTNDGPCGDYFWFNINKPNGMPLEQPEDTYVQLMFAGGKDSLRGQDKNPFIAQLVSGNQVAVDPVSYLNGTTRSTSGSCVDSDILYDPSRRAAGQCCIKYNGSYGTFRQSSWSSTTFLCR